MDVATSLRYALVYELLVPLAKKDGFLTTTGYSKSRVLAELSFEGYVMQRSAHLAKSWVARDLACPGIARSSTCVSYKHQARGTSIWSKCDLVMYGIVVCRAG